MRTVAEPSPNSEAEWKRALALVHPDLPSRSDDGTQFSDLIKARARWRKDQPRFCVQCGRMLQHPRPGKTHCNKYCANQGIAFNRRTQRVLRASPSAKAIPVVKVAQVPGPPVILPAEVYHARHEAVFGRFGTCRHTVCFRARHPERVSA